jgi:hypothetical protein
MSAQSLVSQRNRGEVPGSGRAKMARVELTSEPVLVGLEL